MRRGRKSSNEKVHLFDLSWARISLAQKGTLDNLGEGAMITVRPRDKSKMSNRTAASAQRDCGVWVQWFGSSEMSCNSKVPPFRQTSSFCPIRSRMSVGDEAGP